MTKFTKEQLEYLEANVDMCDYRLGIKNILCDVTGNVGGYVYGDIEGYVGSVDGDIYGTVYGTVMGNVGDVFGTINGRKWKYVDKEIE
tara:strand:+ start:279 stop:542 length:264 start_codon:yes stop_codon:yes gene_type:complete